ncbi:MAG: TonB family protein [Acidobacteriaceae bacterium]|nr:TonB family protein [Acidobacteriaceae bacterium]
MSTGPIADGQSHTPTIRVTGRGSSSAGSDARATISQGVSAGLLLEPIHATYPLIAKTSGVSGVVVVEAVISRQGQVESAHAVSGPVMLQAAAIEAVRAAHYRPFLLNGSPIEVSATFTINFRLHGQ